METGQTMSKLMFGAIGGIALTLAAVAFAATNTLTESERALRLKQMDECFAAHASLMDKPAVKNRVTCWMAHRHLMRG